MEEKYFGPIMKKINEELDRKANMQIKKYNLTLTQARVIIFLAKHEGKMVTQKELEDYLQVSHPTTVTIVKSMEAKKMVKTSFDDADRRMKNSFSGTFALNSSCFSNILRAEGQATKAMNGQLIR